MSHRTDEDHIRSDTSTFTSIAKNPAAGEKENECSFWEFKRVDQYKNKYIITLKNDSKWDQSGWKLNAQIRFDDDVRGIGSGYVFADEDPKCNFEWIIEESRINTFKISLAEDT